MRSGVCLDGALERREPWGVWGGELFEDGRVIPRKRPADAPASTPSRPERDHERRKAIIKHLKLPMLRRSDEPLEYVPDVQEYLQRQQREVPRPVHLGVR